VAISGPDSLSSSETGVDSGKKAEKALIQMSSMSETHW
jgi:hypothetical protein